MSVVFLVVFPVIVVVFDLILPIALLLWALRSRARSRLYLASILVSTAVVIAILAKSIVGFWYVVGAFWPGVYLVAFAVILVLRVRRGFPAPWLPRRWDREFFLAAANILHAGFWALLIPPLLQARSYEGTALNLSPPLRGGEFYVIDRRRQRLGQPAWRLCAGYRQAERPRAQRFGLFSARS